MIKRIDLLMIGINIITILVCLDYSIYTALVNYLAVLDFIFILLIINEYKILSMDFLIYISLTMTVATLSCMYNLGGIGSILILINFILMMYLSTCIKLSNCGIKCISIMYMVLSLYWLVWGKVDSYNTNTIGIIALLSVCFSFVFSATLHTRYIKILLIAVSIWISFLLEKNISHSRTCFICGLLMLVFTWFVPSKFFSNKLIYWAMGLFCTFGSLALTKIYVYLYNASITINLIFSTKRFFSGRELIWIEMWNELDKHWLTGVGSQYNMASLVNGGFNVHNSILNFWAVYGVIVFILALGIIFYKFYDMYKKICFRAIKLSYVGMCCIFVLFIHAIAETTLISSMFYGPILTLFCLTNSEQ